MFEFSTVDNECYSKWKLFQVQYLTVILHASSTT